MICWSDLCLCNIEFDFHCIYHTGEKETEQCKLKLQDAKQLAESVAVITDDLAQEFLKVISFVMSMKFIGFMNI